MFSLNKRMLYLRLFFVLFLLLMANDFDLHYKYGFFASGAVAKRLQRQDPENGGRRAPKVQQQSTRLRMDDGANNAVVFGWAQERGLHLGRRSGYCSDSYRQLVDCLKFPKTDSSKTSYYYYFYHFYFNID